VIATLRRAVLALVWLVVVVVMAVASAGVVAQWSHPPGTPARAELTWHGDQEVDPALDAALADLRAIGDEVDRLSILARGALAALTADDQGPFTTALTEGGMVARAVESGSATLRVTLLALPGDLGTEAILYGSDTRARRATMLAAWAWRNARQLGRERRGAGSSRARLSRRRTLVGETCRPSLASSPQILR